MSTTSDRRAARSRRHLRVRKKIGVSKDRPRLSVFRSLKHIYAQIIDDTEGQTLAAASTLDPEIRDQVAGLKKSEQAKVVGELLAQRATARGVENVIFDRGGYKYHGRVQSLADGARGGGLKF